MGSRASVKVISPAGQRDSRLVGLFRLSSAVAIGGVIVAVGKLAEEGSKASSSTVTVALVLAVVAGLFAYAELAYGGRAARNEERRIRANILRQHFSTPRAGDQNTSGSPAAAVIQMITDNTERITEYRQVYFGATIAAFAIPFVVLAYVGIFVDPVVGFGVMASVPLIPILIGVFMRFFRKTSAHSREERSKLAGRYLDAIRNLVTIRLLGAGERVEAELRVQGEANRGAIMRLLAGNQIVIIVMDGLFALVLICLTAGLVVARADQLSLAQVITTMLLTVLLLERLQQVAGFFYIGMGGMASQRALRAYLAQAHTTPGEVEGVGDVGGVAAANGSEAPVVDGAEGTARGNEVALDGAENAAIVMRDVHFDYGRGPVLAGIDLVVPRGSKVAIIGPSGVGKSTLMSLLRGGLAPQDGLIQINGQTLDPKNLAATRALSATVAQRTWMFTGTVADNLRFARQDATDEELWDALRRANIEREVARMPHGLNTPLGEGAVLVSGGQAQRMSLARALLSQREVLLLDEPTSQIDMQSESEIIDAIAALGADQTVLVVTHRHSLLRVVDQVYELKNGKLELVVGADA